MTSLLDIENLCIDFNTDSGPLNVLDNISLKLESGKTLGLVGESGCGKSVTSLSIMRLLPQPTGNIHTGKIVFNGQDLLQLPANAMHKLRGNRIAMIFQEPMTALNPVKTIGSQLIEVLDLHRDHYSKHEKSRRAVELLEKVGIADAEKRLAEYPHQLSGGMRQRVMIAMALACEPDLLIADEPTTALDVTIQAQILDLMQNLQKEHGMAILFITHDLGVIAELCDDVAVMYAGRVVENAPVETIFESPKHPYTQGLLASIPKLENPSKTPLNTIEGQVPTLNAMPKGCRFKNRCQYSKEDCEQMDHSLETVSNVQAVNCIRWSELPNV